MNSFKVTRHYCSFCYLHFVLIFYIITLNYPGHFHVRYQQKKKQKHVFHSCIIRDSNNAQEAKQHINMVLWQRILNSNSDPDVLKNYRPVSNLAFISKIIEKVVAARLIEHLSSNGLKDQYQSAYRKGHSTETALICVHNDIVSAVDKGCGVCLILLDLSAAFNTVDHTILCTFQENHNGLGGHALDFFKSFLADRTQCISVKGVMSEMNRLIYGVPQGSVLGPIEFCIYTLPLSAILKHYKIDYHIYADDTQIYCSFDTESLDEVLGSLDNCISDIRSWMITNKLKINDSKTEFLLITSPRSKFTKDIQITIGQSNISPSSTCKSLGVMLDDHFAMDAHISNICRSTYFHIWNIGGYVIFPLHLPQPSWCILLSHHV